MRFSTSPLEKTLEDELGEKILSRKDLMIRVAALKKEGRTVVTLNGSFDLLHAGHLYILFEAKKQGDCLIVALNSDDSIRSYKGKDRPIVALEHRLKMMAAIYFVDYVTYFDEPDPRAILEEIAPHIHVNGIEYGDNCIEKSTVEKMGGKIHLVDRIDGLATSDIIKKIKALCVS